MAFFWSLAPFLWFYAMYFQERTIFERGKILCWYCTYFNKTVSFYFLHQCYRFRISIQSSLFYAKLDGSIFLLSPAIKCSFRAWLVFFRESDLQTNLCLVDNALFITQLDTLQKRKNHSTMGKSFFLNFYFWSMWQFRCVFLHKKQWFCINVDLHDRLQLYNLDCV